MSDSPSPKNRARKLWILSAALMWTLVGLVAFSSCRRKTTEPAAQMKVPEATLAGQEIPAFSLTNVSGQAVTNKDLLGQPWVASFLFTQCTKECPAIAEKVEVLAKAFEGTNARFVTISVDPERDTPDALKSYCEARNIDQDQWLFLTGDEKEVESLVMEGFLQPMQGVVDKDTGNPDVLHSPRLVLVGADGRIVDTYNAMDASEVAKLRRKLKEVTSTQTPPEDGPGAGKSDVDEDSSDKNDEPQVVDDDAAKDEKPTDVEDFTLTSQDGKTITKKDLLGKPWVASFIFTRCAYTCPTITLAMKNLHDQLDDVDMQFVGITVDPKYDSPEVLKKYAEAYDSTSERQLFLTGDEKPVYRLITYGFRMYAREVLGEKRQPGFEVAHTNRVVLVDAKGKIVDDYLATNDAEMAKLKRVLQGRSKLGNSIFETDSSAVEAE